MPRPRADSHASGSSIRSQASTSGDSQTTQTSLNMTRNDLDKLIHNKADAKVRRVTRDFDRKFDLIESRLNSVITRLREKLRDSKRRITVLENKVSMLELASRCSGGELRSGELRGGESIGGETIGGETIGGESGGRADQVVLNSNEQTNEPTNRPEVAREETLKSDAQPQEEQTDDLYDFDPIILDYSDQ